MDDINNILSFINLVNYSIFLAFIKLANSKSFVSFYGFLLVNSLISR
ncbi:hypothetical protein CUZ96_0224 [Enterococcus lactis]|nr:hypothetical protein [Enterococcus lactis]